MTIHIHNQQQCQEILAQLNEYADGELAADICRELEQHLTGCPDCRVMLDTLTRTIALYHTLRDEPAALPAEVETRLLARLNLSGAAATGL